MKSFKHQRVQDWIQSPWLRHGVRRIFVVCSEACWEKVDAALGIMELRASSIGHERDFKVILAVDHVRLSGDSVLIENNRNQFGTQLEPSWNQLESSWSVSIRSWNIPTPSWEGRHSFRKLVRGAPKCHKMPSPNAMCAHSAPKTALRRPKRDPRWIFG